jgi:hypothetical protein
MPGATTWRWRWNPWPRAKPGRFHSGFAPAPMSRWFCERERSPAVGGSRRRVCCKWSPAVSRHLSGRRLQSFRLPQPRLHCLSAVRPRRRWSGSPRICARGWLAWHRGAFSARNCEPQPPNPRPEGNPGPAGFAAFPALRRQILRASSWGWPVASLDAGQAFHGDGGRPDSRDAPFRRKIKAAGSQCSRTSETVMFPAKQRSTSFPATRGRWW